MPRLRSCFILALTFLLLSSLALAQRDLGTLTGTVTDPSGAAVPNAKVTITEDATGLSYDVTTSANGEYTRPLLKPGTYTLTVEAAGFRKAEQKNVVVTGGDRIGANIVLTVGDVSQTLEVTAAAPLLQTESAVQGVNLNSSQIEDLPLGGQRNFAYLARLSPGVLPAEQGARDSLGGGFSANGVRSTGENNFLLNGVDNNVNVIDFINQTSYVIGPSVEAIGEMVYPHQRLQRRVWPCGRRCHRRPNQVGHEPVSRDSCSSTSRTPIWMPIAGRTTGRCSASQVHSEPIRRRHRRSHHQEQAVHLRRLSGNEN